MSEEYAPVTRTFTIASTNKAVAAIDIMNTLLAEMELEERAALVAFVTTYAETQVKRFAAEIERGKR